MELDNKLNKMAKDFWSLIEKCATVYRNNELVKFQNNFEQFTHSYVEQYKYILDNYMKDKKESLDRHKVAAIIIIAIIETEILKPKTPDENFTGNYALAVDVALNYMLDEINEIFKKNDTQQIEGYIFPKATTCKTEYYKIFYRNLYYIDKNRKWTLNPLDVAERLFLLEYITLLENKIDPNTIHWK